jgi:hypothetical protein
MFLGNHLQHQSHIPIIYWSIIGIIVKLKIFADKKFCENNIIGQKPALFIVQEDHFSTRKYFPQIFSPPIFLRMTVLEIISKIFRPPTHKKSICRKYNFLCG